ARRAWTRRPRRRSRPRPWSSSAWSTRTSRSGATTRAGAGPARSTRSATGPDGLNLAVVNVPVPGHINPTLPVARALVHRGHRVRYFTSVALAGRVAASGAEPVVYGPAVGPEVMRPPRSLTALARETDGLGAALLPDVLRTLRADPPDLVAYDSMCTWGHTAARAFPAMCWTATVALHASFRTAVFTPR